MDKVRVLHVIEYVDPRDAVEWVVSQAIHGSKIFQHHQMEGPVTIRAATVGNFPEILELDMKVPDGSE